MAAGVFQKQGGSWVAADLWMKQAASWVKRLIHRAT